MKTFFRSFKISIFVSIVALLAFWSCTDTAIKKDSSNQPDLNNEEIRRLVLLDTSYIYPLEQAKINALNLSAQFLDKRDGIKRSISKIITVPSRFSIDRKTLVKTDFSISKPETPSLYIANFNEKHGFVILSADKRSTEIIAIVGSGTIDSVAHRGFRVFLSNAVMHIDEKVAEMESLRDDESFKSMITKLNEAFAKEVEKKSNSKNGRVAVGCTYLRVPGARTSVACPGSDCMYVSSTVPIQSINTTTYIAPVLLSTLWDQGPPYNNGQPEGGCYEYGCGGTSNSKYPAGCVAISEGQVVAYFQAKRNNTFWQSVVGKPCSSYTSDEASGVASLAHSIYLDYGIYVSRECGAVGAGFQIGDLQFTNPRGISPGYGLVQGEWRSWNTGDIRNSLSNGSPVVIQGKQHLCCFIWCWGCGDGHQWVIDGMRDLGIQTTYRFTASYQGQNCTASQSNYYQTYTYTSNTVTNTQIHQNWGWGPSTGSGANDWYAQDVFQSSYQVAGWDNNYNHANYIVAYITPN
jgi:Spi protease inhibitor/Peptidase C10 family